MVRLIPRETKFFDLFADVAANVTDGARLLTAILEDFNNLEVRVDKLKAIEHRGDDLTHSILTKLNQTFITPFDREDIHTLATKLDDIMDNMEETAHRFEVFRIEKPTAPAIALARIIQEACLHLEHAIRACRTLKYPKVVQDHLKEITRLENEADNIYRDADSALFANPPDILMLIKLRELYGWLEETVDACKDVAQVISEIVIKGS